MTTVYPTCAAMGSKWAVGASKQIKQDTLTRLDSAVKEKT